MKSTSCGKPTVDNGLRKIGSAPPEIRSPARNRADLQPGGAQNSPSSFCGFRLPAFPGLASGAAATRVAVSSPSTGVRAADNSAARPEVTSLQAANSKPLAHAVIRQQPAQPTHRFQQGALFPAIIRQRRPQCDRHQIARHRQPPLPRPLDDKRPFLVRRRNRQAHQRRRRPLGHAEPSSVVPSAVLSPVASPRLAERVNQACQHRKPCMQFGPFLRCQRRRPIVLQSPRHHEARHRAAHRPLPDRIPPGCNTRCAGASRSRQNVSPVPLPGKPFQDGLQGRHGSWSPCGVLMVPPRLPPTASCGTATQASRTLWHNDTSRASYGVTTQGRSTGILVAWQHKIAALMVQQHKTLWCSNIS